MKTWEKMTTAEKREAKKEFLARADDFLLKHGRTKSQIRKWPQFQRMFVYEMERPFRNTTKQHKTTKH